MTIDISELIANIRAWEAADKAYNATVDRYEASRTNELYRERKKAWQFASKTGAKITDMEEYSYESIAAFVALADHCERLQAALHDNNVVLETLHTSGAKADYPGYTLGMGDLYELQAQIDANNELLGIETE